MSCIQHVIIVHFAHIIKYFFFNAHYSIFNWWCIKASESNVKINTTFFLFLSIWYNFSLMFRKYINLKKYILKVFVHYKQINGIFAIVIINYFIVFELRDETNFICNEKHPTVNKIFSFRINAFIIGLKLFLTYNITSKNFIVFIL